MASTDDHFELPPAVLYMYCSEPKGRVRTTDLLARRQIKTSIFGKLNDPFDFLPVLNLNASRNAIRKALEGRPDFRLPGHSIEELVEIVKKRFDTGKKNPRSFWLNAVEGKRVICVSERNDGILMWSHYASSHTGFAVGFRREPLSQLSPKALFHKVHYGGARIHYGLANLRLDREPRLNHFLSLLTRKSREWGYEKEWRAMVDSEELTGKIYLPFTPQSVESIILGPDIQPAACRKLQSACHRGGLPDDVKIYRATLSRVSFKILVEKTPRLIGERGAWK